MTFVCLRATRPVLRLSAGLLFFASMLAPGATTATHLRDAKPHPPIVEAPDLGWGLGHGHHQSRPIHNSKEVAEPKALAPKLNAPERAGRAPSAPQVQSGDAEVLRASIGEGAMLKEAADAHDGENPHAEFKEPQPLVDNFLIIYWAGVIVACVAAWFILKIEHVDAKALAEGGAYHETAGSGAWKWHAMQKRGSQANLGAIEFTASGAGLRGGPLSETLTNCNGDYEWSGQHNGRTKYGNHQGAIVFFDQGWKMNHCDDTTSFCFASGSAAGWEPPYKKWTKSIETGETVCLEDGKVQSSHLPENMWSLCLVAALGQAKLPGTNKKAEVFLRANVVAGISIVMAFIQSAALFLIIHDIDPNSDPLTTDPSSPYGSPWSVNTIKVIMTFLLAIALVSEAGQVKATFQVALEVYSSRLRSSRWLPITMISIQYLMGIAVVWAGCCAILSFQSVPDIIYSSMAITCISNVDEFFYEAFQEVTGLDADFRVMKRLEAEDAEDAEDSEATQKDHTNSVRPLPFLYHFCSKLGLFFPMVFACAVFGRAWYSGHMPSERVTLFTGGALSWLTK